MLYKKNIFLVLLITTKHNPVYWRKEIYIHNRIGNKANMIKIERVIGQMAVCVLIVGFLL